MKKMCCILLMLVLFGTLLGCSTTQSTIKFQSNFAYPNSNVTAMGRVKGVAKKTTVLIAPSPKAAFREKAVKDALAQKPGADMLVNYTEAIRTITIPIPPFIYIMRDTVEGTAVKMTVGEQALK